MALIYVYSWKPKSSINFGDEIGPMVVEALCRKIGLDLEIVPTVATKKSKLLAVGSVIHEANDGDVVWGVGVNSKHSRKLAKGTDIMFNAVRGPLTRSILLNDGFDCPEIYGDPGLLFPMLFDKEIRACRGRLERAAEALGTTMPETLVIPNLNDDRFLPQLAQPKPDKSIMVLRPNLNPITIAAYISAAKYVISSSLHGLVFADVYRKSIVRMISQYEPEFKYTDYYEGTGRSVPMAYPTVEAALDGDFVHALEWNPEPLIRAFPLFKEEMIDRLKLNFFKLQIGSYYSVSDLGIENTPFTAGWSHPTDGVVWSISDWVDLDFFIKGGVQPNSSLYVNLGALTVSSKPAVCIRVVHNGKAVDTFFVSRKKGVHPFRISLDDFIGESSVSIRLKIENTVRPADHGLGNDVRDIGVYVQGFIVEGDRTLDLKEEQADPAPLNVLATLPESERTVTFKLETVQENRGWTNPNFEGIPKYLWAKKVVSLRFDRNFLATLDNLTLFLSKVADNVQVDTISVEIDGNPLDAEFVKKNGSQYIRINLEDFVHHENESDVCSLEINFGSDAPPLDVFGSTTLPRQRFAAQVRKIGATLSEKKADSAPLNVLATLPESERTVTFKLETVQENRGWTNPNFEDIPKYLWAKKVVSLRFDRNFLATLDNLTLFLSKVADNVQVDTISVEIDGNPLDAEFVKKNGSQYIRINLEEFVRHESESDVCSLEINFGSDASPLDVFGSTTLPRQRFAAQVRKIGATLRD
ncbi:polysaccharide pyruvyl transferase family protein [Roseibium sediminicola]|uniref:Polysaccharide pyruvyl transferase family protein n=1 Tax=Roseibium sediminicola TaxID=2933272 RepID=A0ABT0H3H8_9HYPH|nr:polysaccharide pyruvyl transferase family protein [Roseibium sp. CAU 1639]MCK7616249.1 polysaccharide pyruvyl transferase family protein [Roseibium sp. CAU 1639]